MSLHMVLTCSFRTHFMTFSVSVVAALATSAAEARLTGHAVEGDRIEMGFSLFCTWHRGQPP